MKKYVLALLFIASPIYADKIPPGAMIGNGFEVPVNIQPTAGEVVSFPGPQGHTMSATLGEALSGEMVDPNPNCPATEPCRLEIGYGFFEFYSDRIPVYNVSVSVNNGRETINTRNVSMEVGFTDDLSGLSSAEIREQGTGQTQTLNTLGANVIPWTLGGSSTTVPDGDYVFELRFADRAGNSTVSPTTASIRLDRIAPNTGSVLINNGNLYTSNHIVTVRLDANDLNSVAPTGISYVRLSNGPTGYSVVYPFVEPYMIIQWTLDNQSFGEKTVYAHFQDGAGNWTVEAASDTITLGAFSPGGTLTFQEDGQNTILGQNGWETRLLSVPLEIGWSTATAGSLSTVRISGGVSTMTITIPINQTPPLIQPYTLANQNELDGPRVIQAVFVDAELNESLPVVSTITLNRSAPANPDVQTSIHISSITFHAHADPSDQDILSLSFVPALYENGASSASIPVSYSSETVTYTDDQLLPNRSYSYTIRAHDAFSGSIPGYVTNPPLFTLAEAPTVSSAPVGLEVNLIRVYWGTGNNPLETLYRLEWSEDPTFVTGVFDNGWSNFMPYDVGNLTVATTYYFRVRARNNQTPLPVETETVFLGSGVTQSFVQPLPPISFSAVEVASTSIRWEWVRQSSTEEGFVIRDSTGGIVADIPLQISTPTYSYLETGVSPNTLHTRTIQSYNHLNSTLTFSSPTGAVNVWTKPAPPEPRPYSIYGSEITALWGANGNPNGTEYKADIALDENYSNELTTGSWIQDLEYAFRGLAPQTTYYVRVKSRGQGLTGGERDESEYVHLGPAFTLSFGHQNELGFSDPLGVWHLYLPANALEEDFVLSMKTDLETFSSVPLEVIERANEKAMTESGGYRFPIPLGIAEIRVSNLSGQPLISRLRKQGQLSHQYEGQLSGAPSAAGSHRPSFQNPVNNKSVFTNTLRIWVLDPVTESWFRLPGNDVDTFLNEVQGSLNQFGVFAVMGGASQEVSDAIAFPVPWRPHGPNAGDGPGQTGTESSGIQFGNLPQEGVLKIYDLNGALVRQIDLTGNITESWSAQNQSGEKVASGTYYWVVESGPNRKTGKLMVIR